MQIGDIVLLGTPPASQIFMYMEVGTSTATGIMTVRPFTYRRDGTTRANLTNATATIAATNVWQRLPYAAPFIMESQSVFMEIGGAAAPSSGFCTYMFFTSDN